MTLSKKPSAVNPRPSATNKRPSAVNARPTNAGLSRHPDSGAGPVTPATPTLTAPANNANVFNTLAVTVSATTTDTNLDQMDWLLDGVVVATVAGVGTPAGTYSTTWTPSATDGAHSLVARATRSAATASSSAITVNVGEILHTLVTSVTCLRAWQSDFGAALGGTPLASGTAPPVVTLTGSPASAIALRVEITLLGTLGIAQFRYSADGGGTYIQSNVATAASVVLTGAATGITLAFPAGAYVTDNVYVGTCSGWTDQKSLAAATQATAANQPALGIGLLNRPKLTGDGVNDILREATLDLPAAGTTNTFVWGIIKQITWTASRGVWSSGTTLATNELGAGSTTPALISYCGTVSADNTAATLGTLLRSEQFFSNTTADYLKLGATTVTGVNTGNLNPAAGWNLFSATNGAANCGNFEVYACLIFAGKPSAGELAALSAAAAAMYPGVAV